MQNYEREHGGIADFGLRNGKRGEIAECRFRNGDLEKESRFDRLTEGESRTTGHESRTTKNLSGRTKPFCRKPKAMTGKRREVSSAGAKERDGRRSAVGGTECCESGSWFVLDAGPPAPHMPVILD